MLRNTLAGNDSRLPAHTSDTNPRKDPVREIPGAMLLLYLAVAAAPSGCGQSNGKGNQGRGGATSGGVVEGGHPGLGGASATGGSPRSGGATGTGGGPENQGGKATGGMVAAGGTSSQGGMASEGGKPGTGGAAGAAGATGSGGAAGSGGNTSSGGATGSGGNADASVSPKDASMETASPDAGAIRNDVATSPDAATAACTGSQPVPAAGDTTVTLTHGGRSRKYLLHVPSALVAGTALAVVVDLHGAGGNGSQQKGMSGFSALSDKEKFLAVFPDGIDGYWNVDDTCCGTAGKEKIDDVGFIKAIIARLRTDTCIDAARIYVTGFSNGGGLTHRMGCDAADVVAAIAPMSTDLRTQPCKATRPISMMEVRGMADSLEPYEGGMVGPADGQYLAVGAKASLKLWADINSCTGATTTLDKYCESYTQCEDGVEADLCSLPNVDHSPYNNSLGFNIASTAWKMFQRQPMR